MALVTVTDATFEQHVLRSELPILVDFWAEWCPPCRPMARVLEELAGELDGKVAMAKINSDENPVASRGYRIMSLPTLLLFRDGQIVATMVGARSKSALRDALAKSL
ncbi:MAG TPA: thioredoxin [Candidatus Limnocylindrales bacterium]|nr:thioredoxin [Candidatus Limnocylindrales bacterium]